MEDPVYLPKCFTSPSCCVPRHEEYRRLPVPPAESGSSSRSRQLWRKLFRRVLREGNKCLYRSMANNKKRLPPLTFQYDAVSYSHNFDEGSHIEDHLHFSRFSPVLRDHVR